MMEQSKAIQYVLKRLQEPSAWRGIAMIIAAGGATLSPEQQEAIVVIGLAASGLIGLLFPDKLERRPCEDAGV